MASKMTLCGKIFAAAMVLGGVLMMAGCTDGTEDKPGGKDALYVKGELLASEDFSGTLDDWLAEGDVDARIEDGRLYFESTEKTEVTKGNIWWKKHFSGDIQIEYDFQSLSDSGLSMAFWHAHGRNGEDLLSWQRTGVYEEYVIGKMNAYHVSYHRLSSGVSNFRKSYGFHMVCTARDPIEPQDRDTHHILIYSQGKRQRVLIDGEVVHDFADEGEPCLSPEKGWVHEYPCKGTGSHLTEGKIGIRHMQRQRAYYDNFKVYRLVAP